MMLGTKIAQSFRVLLLVGLVALTGCENGNLFGKLHDSGDSGNTQALLSDAQVALDRGDYGAALALYNRILDSDSDNALALFGAASANAGLSGLNVGQLLANVLNDNGGLGATSLGDAIHSATRGVGMAGAASNSILRNLHPTLSFLREAADQLVRIARGDTDGSIRRSDIGVLVDIAVIKLIIVARDMIDADVFDIVNEDGRLKFVAKAGAAAYCGSPDGAARIRIAGSALCDVYAVLNRAAITAGVKATTLSKFRNDVDEIIAEGLDGDLNDDLDATCVAVLNAEGINSSSFRTYSTLN